MGDQIADPDLDAVAAAKLADDRKDEQGAVPNAALAIKEKRTAQICFCVSGRFVPTFFPAFHAVRSRLASSY